MTLLCEAVHGRPRSSTVYDGQSMAIFYFLLAFIRDSSHHIIVFPYYTVNHYLSQIFKIYKNCSTFGFADGVELQR